MQDIEIISLVKEMQLSSEQFRIERKTIGFVPTMGFLHEGHLSLVRKARKRCDRLIVSIFVNPEQFAPGEDLSSYPRDLERDLKLLRAENVDIVFTPDEALLYPEGYQTYVSLKELPQYLCGVSRPTFFRGVATVVTKLFNIVKPHLAVFGRKDYQQFIIIQRMVRDLHLDIEILAGETIRETDGLAMSSRNSYLLPNERSTALSLIKSLKAAQKQVEDNETDVRHIISQATKLVQQHSLAKIDYIAISDPETLVPVDKVLKPVLMAIAVIVGKTRLIDNMILTPQDERLTLRTG